MLPMLVAQGMIDDMLLRQVLCVLGVESSQEVGDTHVGCRIQLAQNAHETGVHMKALAWLACADSGWITGCGIQRQPTQAPIMVVHEILATASAFLYGANDNEGALTTDHHHSTQAISNQDGPVRYFDCVPRAACERMYFGSECIRATAMSTWDVGRGRTMITQ